jgi:tight adherence protein B
MDTSGSMQGAPIIAAKAAALSFVNRLPAETNVAVVGFSDAPEVASPFTTDRGAIAAAIDSFQANGETALYDGVLAAANLLGTGTGDQRAIVLLSDGGDTVSAAPIEQAVERLAGANAGFTAIELTTGETDRASLDRLAGAASGRVVSVDEPGALDATYSAIAQRLSNLYEVRFFSSGATRADLSISIDHQGVSSSVLAPVEFPDRPAGATSTTIAEIAAAEPFIQDGGVSGALLLAVGGVLVLFGLGLGIFVAIGDREPQRRLADEYAHAGLDEDGVEWLSGLANRAAAFGEQLANRGGQTATIDQRLDAAGLSMRAGELIAMVAAAAVGAAMFGFLLLGPFGFIIGLVLPPALALPVLTALQDRRRRKFSDQLGDTLVLLSSSLRAGYGLVQAVDAVARETDAPMSVEFGRVVVETRLGRDLNEALDAVAQRVGSEDFEWVVEAMEIHREVGGDLAEVLDHVAETIRARTRIVRQVRALAAEGKISAIVLFALPIAVGILIASSNPDYTDRLFNTTAGKIMLAVAAALMVAGGLWLRRLVRPEF